MLEEFHARLGEDFMVLLPETIPFLAELMEGEVLSIFFLLIFANVFLFISVSFHLLCSKIVLSDEYFEVEHQCQHVINEMERVLGEPLQKYF